MATKNVQLKDLSGNLLMPKTLGSNVFNNANKALGGVEENAQVNVLEGVQFNGSDLSISSKKVNLQLTITKEATATEGYFATYKLYNGATAVGDAINIPKDYLVKSASMKTCSVAGVPETTPALAVGDPYLDFVINTKDNETSTGDQHIYINVKGLVDTYTEGNGIDITNNVVSVDLTGYAKASAAAAIAGTDTLNTALGKLEYKADNAVVKNADITGATKCKITYDAKGLVTGGADLQATDIPELAASKISAMTGYEKASTAGAIAAADSLNEAIGKLEKGLDGKVAANAAITGASKCKITYDSKGLVTAGADLAATDIPELAASKISAMTGYTAITTGEVAAVAATDTLNEAVAKLQYAVSKSQDAITGAASTIVTNNLTANKFVVSNGDGKIAASTIGSDAALIVWEELE